MEVLLCQNTAMLGWRRDVTKIVVLITDAPQHISGDGLVAGIWKPYKHECSLVDVSRHTLSFCDLKSWVSLLIHSCQGDSSWTQDGRTRPVKIYPSLEQDYPSLADINYQLEQTDTTLIFGTPSKVLSLYQQMVDEPNLFRRAVAKDIGTDGVININSKHP